MKTRCPLARKAVRGAGPGLFGSPPAAGGPFLGGFGSPGAVDVKQAVAWVSWLVEACEAYKERMIRIYQQHNPSKVLLDCRMCLIHYVYCMCIISTL